MQTSNFDLIKNTISSSSFYKNKNSLRKSTDFLAKPLTKSFADSKEVLDFYNSNSQKKEKTENYEENESIISRKSKKCRIISKFKGKSLDLISKEQMGKGNGNYITLYGGEHKVFDKNFVVPIGRYTAKYNFLENLTKSGTNLYNLKSFGKNFGKEKNEKNEKSEKNEKNYEFFDKINTNLNRKNEEIIENFDNFEEDLQENNNNNNICENDENLEENFNENNEKNEEEIEEGEKKYFEEFFKNNGSRKCKCFVCKCGKCKCEYVVRAKYPEAKNESIYQENYKISPQIKKISELSDSFKQFNNKTRFFDVKTTLKDSLITKTTNNLDYQKPKLDKSSKTTYSKDNLSEKEPLLIKTSMYKSNEPVQIIPPASTNMTTGMPFFGKTTYSATFKSPTATSKRYKPIQIANPLSTIGLPFMGESTSKSQYKEFAELKKKNSAPIFTFPNPSKQISLKLPAFPNQFKSMNTKEYPNHELSDCPAKLIE